MLLCNRAGLDVSIPRSSRVPNSKRRNSQAVSNGANQTLPLAMGLKNEDNVWIGKDPIWKFASINAITYLAAAMFGELLRITLAR